MSSSELEATVERGLVLGRQSGNAFITQHLEMVRWMNIARSKDAAEAANPLAQLARAPLPTVAGTAQSNVAYALIAAGDLAGAERAAKEGLAKSTGMTVLEAQAHAVLAAVHMASGRLQDALAAADSALALPVMGFPRHLDECELIRAEALMAIGRSEDAHEAIQVARAHVLGTAESLDDEDRSSYLTQVRASVRILGLASEWLGDV